MIGNKTSTKFGKNRGSQPKNLWVESDYLKYSGKQPRKNRRAGSVPMFVIKSDNRRFTDFHHSTIMFDDSVTE